TRLTASAGVAPSKFVAKIASEVAKPDGVVVVPPDGVASFLAPLPVRYVWGVGRVAQGASALVALARGIDDRPVHPARRPKSIGEERTFDRDLTAAELPPRLLAQAEDVARRLRARGLRARTLALKLKLAGPSREGRFPTRTRRTTLAEPTADDGALFAVARALLDAVDLGARRVRLAGLAASGLVRTRPEQLALFGAAREAASRRDAAARAVDRLVARFGPDVVRRALPRAT